VSVRTVERKAGFLGVIEAGGFPGRRGMAAGAFRSALSTVHIIRRMAGHTLRRRPFVAISEMALDASDGLVLVVQREGSLAVIEARVLPHLGIVAGSAIPPQLAPVRLLRLVAHGTFPRSISKGLAGLVAAAAGQSDVCALQREIRVVVIELLTAEFHDIGVTALMLRVTRTALSGVDPPQAAVKPMVCTDVGRDAFVTVETQLPLAATVAAVMAIRALFFQFLMGRGQLARHEEFFRIHGCSTLRWEDTQQDCDKYTFTPCSGSHQTSRPRQ